MTTLQRTPARSKVNRTCRLSAPDPSGLRTLTLTVGEQTFAYCLVVLRTDYSRGFRLTKLVAGAEAEVYDVNVNPRQLSMLNKARLSTERDQAIRELESRNTTTTPYGRSCVNVPSDY